MTWRIERQRDGRYSLFRWDANAACYGGPVGGDWEYMGSFSWRVALAMMEGK